MFVPGRNSRQCRDRYTNYLAPGLIHADWSEEEDKLLAEQFNLNGPKWTQIKKLFPTRSANDIKNRYNYTVCHKYQKLLEIHKEANNDEVKVNDGLYAFDDEDEGKQKEFNIFNEDFIGVDDMHIYSCF